MQTQVLTLNFGKFFQLSIQFICGGGNTPTSQIYVFRKNEDHRAYLACSNSSVTVEVFLMFTAVRREEGGAVVGVGNGEDELINCCCCNEYSSNE